MIFATNLFRPDANTPDIARNVLAWVIDLETTTAKQGRVGRLCLNGQYCCLGRGCEVLGVERIEDVDGTVAYGKSEVFLPGKATAMLGLRTKGGGFSRRITDGKWEVYSLTGLNDWLEWSFPQIAEFIRNSWERQFSKPLEESL